MLIINTSCTFFGYTRRPLQFSVFSCFIVQNGSRLWFPPCRPRPDYVCPARIICRFNELEKNIIIVFNNNNTCAAYSVVQGVRVSRTQRAICPRRNAFFFACRFFFVNFIIFFFSTPFNYGNFSTTLGRKKKKKNNVIRQLNAAYSSHMRGVIFQRNIIII